MTFIPRDIFSSDTQITNYLAANGFPNRSAIDWYQVQNFILSPASLQDKKNRFDYFCKYVRESWDPTDLQYPPSQRIEDGRFTINVQVNSGPSVAQVLLGGSYRYVRMWNYSPPYYDDYSFYGVRYPSPTKFRYGSYTYYYQLFYYPKWWEDQGYRDPRDFGMKSREGMVVQSIQLDDQRRLFLMATRYPWAPWMTELDINTFWRVNFSYWQQSQNFYDYTYNDRRL